MKKYLSKADLETQRIGEQFALKLKLGDVVLLYGDLGFGKTTFAKGIAKGLGIKSRIISPTFTIVRTYGKTHHIDLYRIEKPEHLRKIGLQEILEDQSFIKLIEWPEKLDYKKKAWKIKFELGEKPQERKITINE
jgi:tRNA threonylcarbamoyladenosine biosynthesis protein TsaE